MRRANGRKNPSTEGTRAIFTRRIIVGTDELTVRIEDFKNKPQPNASRKKLGMLLQINAKKQTHPTEETSVLRP
jgi:hypothetical protein